MTDNGSIEAEGLRLIDGGDEAPLIRRQPRERFCRHDRFELDVGARRVYCGRCEQEIDAFSALQQIASMFERVNGRYRAASAEARRVEAALAELKRQERNAKARMRRLT